MAALSRGPSRPWRRRGHIGVCLPVPPHGGTNEEDYRIAMIAEEPRHVDRRGDIACWVGDHNTTRNALTLARSWQPITLRLCVGLLTVGCGCSTHHESAGDCAIDGLAETP
jgi:hypothetical protein